MLAFPQNRSSGVQTSKVWPQCGEEPTLRREEIAICEMVQKNLKTGSFEEIHGDDVLL